MKIDYELLNSICNDVIAKHSSIRWAGIANRNGVILAQKARKEAKLLLSDEENEEYAATAIARQKTRGRFEPQIGKMIYSFGRYELLHRATIPISSSYFLLITLDVEEKNFDSIIMDMILPIIKESRDRFTDNDNSV
ncbi:MAG: hypothetical protein M3270_04955 [Thermoproteota archaeon]|nr:hypothetical protein [Thermoproteota archaeon]